MDAFAAELEACLASLDEPASDLDATVVQRPGTAPAARQRKRVSRWALASIALGVLALAAVVIGLVATRGVHLRDGSTPSAAATITLKGIGSWDPFGDNEEHSSKASLATDKNDTTYWYTEHYRSGLGKAGVGLLLDAGHAVKPRGVTVVTTTPGFKAEVQAGNDRSGADFHPVSQGGPRSINGSTTLQLDLHSAQRYFVVWITELPPGVASVNINEVTAD